MLGVQCLHWTQIPLWEGTFRCSWDRGLQILYKILILKSHSMNNKLIYMVETEELGLSSGVDLILVALNRTEHKATIKTETEKFI